MNPFKKSHCVLHGGYPLTVSNYEQEFDDLFAGKTSIGAGTLVFRCA
jgi:hypothetical protein